MKFLKTLVLALAVSIAAINVADAGSIGRSGGSSFSSGRSFSSGSSSFSSGRSSSSSSSIGVSKSNITNGVRNDMPKPSTPTPSTPSTPSYGSAPTPHYAPAYAPAPVVVHHDSGFGGAFAGSMFGSMMGNALSRPAAAPVVVTGGGGQVVSSGETIVSNSNTPVVVEKESYGIGHFLLDVILFAVLMGVLVVICLLAYQGYKALKNYVNSERGLDNNPFPPTQRFWEIQRAFGTADKVELSRLLGPDMLDEILNDIEPSEIKLNNVSHEVRLLNNREFSVWYKFDDKLEEVHVNQVWHFEKIGGEWKLNGIETI